MLPDWAREGEEEARTVPVTLGAAWGDVAPFSVRIRLTGAKENQQINRPKKMNAS